MKRAKFHRAATVEAELVRRVRARGQLSRVELARELNIAPSTAGIYVDRLLERGFLAEAAGTRSRSGRPPTLLKLNADGGRFLGLDFEARNIMAVAVDFSQHPLREVHRRIGARDSVETVLELIEAALEDVMRGDRRPVLGIGLGVPGDVDSHSGLALHYPFIKGWKSIPVRDRFEKRFGLPVFLENNTRAMALAEMWFGQGRGLRDFICLAVRSGIAAGVVANGRLLRGSDSLAGEIGRWHCPAAKPFQAPVTGKKRRDTDGEWSWRPGPPLEQVASVSAALKFLTECSGRSDGEASIETLVEAIRAGNSDALTVLNRVAEAQGWAVAQLSLLCDPQKIIVTGPLTELGELFLEPLRVAAHAWGASKPTLQITCSQLGKFSGALGAAALALQQWKPKS